MKIIHQYKYSEGIEPIIRRIFIDIRSNIILKLKLSHENHTK